MAFSPYKITPLAIGTLSSNASEFNFCKLVTVGSVPVVKYKVFRKFSRINQHQFIICSKLTL